MASATFSPKLPSRRSATRGVPQIRVLPVVSRAEAVTCVPSRADAYQHLRVLELPTSANGQPAVAFYVGNGTSGPHLAWSITVLTLRSEHIAELTSFLGPDHFAPFRLPPSLP
jgi:hypothetical protein